jgi:hypothetical protein
MSEKTSAIHVVCAYLKWNRRKNESAYLITGCPVHLFRLLTDKLTYGDFLVEATLGAGQILPGGGRLTNPHELGNEEGDGADEDCSHPLEAVPGDRVWVDADDGEKDGDAGRPDDSVEGASHEVIGSDTICFGEIG